MPESAVTAIKAVPASANMAPFLSIRIRGKIELIHLFDYEDVNNELKKILDQLTNMVKIGDWYIKKTLVKEYIPVCRVDDGVMYIKVLCAISDFKINFSKKEDMDEELRKLDDIFQVK